MSSISKPSWASRVATNTSTSLLTSQSTSHSDSANAPGSPSRTVGVVAFPTQSTPNSTFESHSDSANAPGSPSRTVGVSPGAPPPVATAPLHSNLTSPSQETVNKEHREKTKQKPKQNQQQVFKQQFKGYTPEALLNFTSLGYSSARPHPVPAAVDQHYNQPMHTPLLHWNQPGTGPGPGPIHDFQGASSSGLYVSPEAGFIRIFYRTKCYNMPVSPNVRAVPFTPELLQIFARFFQLNNAVRDLVLISSNFEIFSISNAPNATVFPQYSRMLFPGIYYRLVNTKSETLIDLCSWSSSTLRPYHNMLFNTNDPTQSISIQGSVSLVQQELFEISIELQICCVSQFSELPIIVEARIGSSSTRVLAVHPLGIRCGGDSTGAETSAEIVAAHSALVSSLMPLRCSTPSNCSVDTVSVEERGPVQTSGSSADLKPMQSPSSSRHVVQHQNQQSTRSSNPIELGHLWVFHPHQHLSSQKVMVKLAVNPTHRINSEVRLSPQDIYFIFRLPSPSSSNEKPFIYDWTKIRLHIFLDPLTESNTNHGSSQAAPGTECPMDLIQFSQLLEVPRLAVRTSFKDEPSEPLDPFLSRIIQDLLSSWKPTAIVNHGVINLSESSMSLQDLSQSHKDPRQIMHLGNLQVRDINDNSNINRQTLNMPPVSSNAIGPLNPAAVTQSSPGSAHQEFKNLYLEPTSSTEFQLNGDVLRALYALPLFRSAVVSFNRPDPCLEVEFFDVAHRHQKNQLPSTTPVIQALESIPRIHASYRNADHAKHVAVRWVAADALIVPEMKMNHVKPVESRQTVDSEPPPIQTAAASISAVNVQEFDPFPITSSYTVAHSPHGISSSSSSAGPGIINMVSSNHILDSEPQRMLPYAGTQLISTDLREATIGLFIKQRGVYAAITVGHVVLCGFGIPPSSDVVPTTSSTDSPQEGQEISAVIRKPPTDLSESQLNTGLVSAITHMPSRVSNLSEAQFPTSNNSSLAFSLHIAPSQSVNPPSAISPDLLRTASGSMIQSPLSHHEMKLFGRVDEVICSQQLDLAKLVLLKPLPVQFQVRPMWSGTKSMLQHQLHLLFSFNISEVMFHYLSRNKATGDRFISISSASISDLSFPQVDLIGFGSSIAIRNHLVTRCSGFESTVPGDSGCLLCAIKKKQTKFVREKWTSFDLPDVIPVGIHRASSHDDLNNEVRMYACSMMKVMEWLYQTLEMEESEPITIEGSCMMA